MLTWWGIENRNSCYSCHSCSKTPNPGRLYGKVDTKLFFQERLVIGLTEQCAVCLFPIFIVGIEHITRKPFVNVIISAYCWRVRMRI